MTLLSTFIKVGGPAVILKDIADRIVNTRLTREQTLRRNRAGMLVLGVAIGSTIGVLHKWSRDNFNLAPEVIADILSEVFLSGMLPLLS